MLTLTIQIVEDSHVIILPEEVLTRLNVGEGDVVQITKSDYGFKLSSISSEAKSRVPKHPGESQ